MQEVKFGVFADLHVDIIHDAQHRLEVFLEDCRKENVDFIVQLGDFCYPDSHKCVCKPEHRPINIQLALQGKNNTDKNAIVSLFRNFEKPSFHVMGNHDCDFCSKKEVLEYYGAEPKTWYSFDLGGFHFVVIDGNYYRCKDAYYSYNCGNYFDCPFEGGTLPWIPPEELHWLEMDLKDAKYPAVLFSHQRLTEADSSVRNADEVKKILEKAPQGVVLALNGHEHLDEAEKVNGTWFYNVNSMSNFWVGTEYKVSGRYGEEIDRKYPNMPYVIPYREPVYSIVTLTMDGARVKGVCSEEVGPTAKEMGINKGNWYCDIGNLRVDVTASSKDRYLPF